MGKEEVNYDNLLDLTSSRDSLLPEQEGDRYYAAHLRQKTPSVVSETDSCQIEISVTGGDDDDESHCLPARAYPNEYGKTLQAFLFLIIGLLISCLSLAMVHDQQPTSSPLPDVVFRYVPQLDDGLALSEYLIIMITYPTLLVLLLHQHRSIIFRRIFLLAGLLYFCRGFTMFVTVLPQADLKFPCAARGNATTFLMITHRAFSLLSGLGMSINGKLIYCGDFIYSGHTCSLVMCCLVFAEYTPQQKQIFRIWKWSLYFLATLGISLVSFSRTHYTVDILIAYAITTTFFRIYHTIAAHSELKVASDTNHLSSMWWFRLVQHFEKNVPEGKIPLRFSFLPPGWPKSVSYRLQDWRLFS